MATASDHFDQYKRNRALLGNLATLSPPPWDWMVTITFYAAVHLVEYIIVSKLNKSSENHDQRKKYIAMVSELKPIGKIYMRLEFISHQSRYQCIPFNEKSYKQCLKQLEDIENKLI
ncbi:hypothetical protein [Effusibacillus lacus]|uniref:HEPN domain-containing protein n=1 Tax=Effusibacillus lacus TaxID=1348429 RepID=A0A292YDP9_9BACL|nr:hypothetical protein [Effusibacillus lacus]TCS76536.1 hypothetical protein EDD64_10281 [Effusibacillus lacus]GAX90442.1 hypothetical protein EFBL_2069 [Effusibacillus lacus]